jgi:1-acyl-sn-glycerol-3-phosphate acyltransferase
LPKFLIDIAQKLFGVYAVVVFCVLSLIALVCVTVLPPPRYTYRAAQFLARMIFVFWGMRPSIRGLGNLPRDGAYILASNHASYIDGVLLFAYLPQPHRFAIKIEIAAVAPLRFFLTRIGMRFVDRFDAHKNITQTRRLIELLKQGTRLAFFPEGTFQREAGLLPFRLGAFRVASLAQVPVIPLVIRGSREVLPSESWLPRFGHLEIVVITAISPLGSDGEAANQLKQAARVAMLKELDEPDLEKSAIPANMSS